MNSYVCENVILTVQISVIVSRFSVGHSSGHSSQVSILKKEFEFFQTFFSLSISGEKLNLHNLLVFIEDT